MAAAPPVTMHLGRSEAELPPASDSPSRVSPTSVDRWNCESPASLRSIFIV